MLALVQNSIPRKTQQPRQDSPFLLSASSFPSVVVAWVAAAADVALDGGGVKVLGRNLREAEVEAPASVTYRLEYEHR